MASRLFDIYHTNTIRAMTDDQKIQKSCDKLDGLCSGSLCEHGMEFPHSQPDDLIFILVVFDGHRQPLHVEFDLHILKLQRINKIVYNQLYDTVLCIVIPLIYSGRFQTKWRCILSWQVRSGMEVTHILWQVGISSCLTVSNGSVEFSFLSRG